MAEIKKLTSKPAQRMQRGNIRKHALYNIGIALLLLLLIIVSSLFFGPEKLDVNFLIKDLKPSFTYPFGTDWLGRDMLTRTLKGLSLSFWVGTLAAVLSVAIALVLSLIATFSKLLDNLITWLIDLFIGVPHIVSLILISFALGGGLKGVVIGIAVTHWPSLTRLLRAEVYQVQGMEYIAISKNLGKSKWWIGIHHILPHLIPQLLVGFVLLFPHAILHEAAITFLGFGLSSEQPAIGIILSESMGHLSSGMWWLAFFPGLALLIMVGIFDILGRNLRKLIDPFGGQKL